MLPGTRGRSGDGDGTPLQHSCLENSMDGGACRLQSMGSRRVGHDWASDFTFTFHFHALEKDMATHSSVLAWRVPGTGEPGGLPSMGSHRVGHDWSDAAAAAAAGEGEDGKLLFGVQSFCRGWWKWFEYRQWQLTHACVFNVTIFKHHWIVLINS